MTPRHWPVKKVIVEDRHGNHKVAWVPDGLMDCIFDTIRTGERALDLMKVNANHNSATHCVIA